MSTLKLRDKAAQQQYEQLQEMQRSLAIEISAATVQNWPPHEVIALLRRRAAEIEPIFNAVQAAWRFENVHPTDREVH